MAPSAISFWLPRESITLQEWPCYATSPTRVVNSSLPRSALVRPTPSQPLLSYAPRNATTMPLGGDAGLIAEVSRVGIRPRRFRYTKLRAPVSITGRTQSTPHPSAEIRLCLAARSVRTDNARSKPVLQQCSHLCLSQASRVLQLLSPVPPSSSPSANVSTSVVPFVHVLVSATMCAQCLLLISTAACIPTPHLFAVAGVALSHGHTPSLSLSNLGQRPIHCALARTAAGIAVPATAVPTTLQVALLL